MKSPFKIRGLKEDEITQHLFLLNTGYGGWGDRQKWERKYLQQPEFDIKKNVVVIEEDGELTAGGAYWVRNLLIQEKNIRAAIFGDAVVAPNHRGKGFWSIITKKRLELARENNIALAFMVVAIGSIPFKASLRYSFIDIFYPQTKLKILRPERFLALLEKPRITLFERFEGTTLKLIVENEPNPIEVRFLLKNGRLKRYRKNRDIDLTIKTDITTLFELYTRMSSLKRLFISVMGAITRRKLKFFVTLGYITHLIRSWFNG